MRPVPVVLAVVAAAAVAGGGWLAFRPAAVAVETALVARGPLRVTLVEQGETRAHDRFVVTAPAAGRVERVAAHEGDAVAAGDTVAVLHVAPLSAAEREAQLARIAAAEASVREAAELARKSRTALEQAVRERERSERLVREKFVAAQAAEQARTAEAGAEAERAAAEARLRAASAQAAAVRAALTPADPTASSRPVRLRAPAAGRVLRIFERSERVVAAGAPLVTVGDPRLLEVVADFLSTDAVRIRPGMAAMLSAWGGAPIGARVRVVEPAAFTKVSALGVEEQRVNVVLDLAEVPAGLGDGFRVDVAVVVSEAADVLKVPASAVFARGGGHAVFAVRGGRAQRLDVVLGLANRDEAEVRDGLAPGDEVVRYPTSALREGVRVTRR
jgi:HlyD family secretion protein